MPQDVKKIFTKEFLASVDEALVRGAETNAPTTILFKRKSKLDIRVKIDSTPPTPATTTIVFEET